ncbi:MAG: AmmeMemoRadiSam system radical SAM enzyme [Bacillota bacterium]|nr:AmmeMemoRadiSam system radical SAM enzyme [Bacillota bacterium]
MNRVKCEICPHECSLKESQHGFCRARSNKKGVICDDNYGLLTSLALDPIEKKPLRRFYPGSKILSVGSFGCNFRCPFCQNFEISMSGIEYANTVYMPPEDLVSKAVSLKSRGNIGIAYTFNEPLIGYEYIFDTALLVRAKSLKNVVVTNGFINEKPLRALLPYIDAFNIDLKSLSERFYQKIGGNLETVKQTIEISVKACHVEITLLVIPGLNDSPDEVRNISGWLAGIDKGIPLHVTRFFPRYKMSDWAATPPETIYELARIARESLLYVYEGNC